MSKILMSNQMIPIALNLLAAVAGAVGQFCYKLGGMRIDVIPLYRNFYLFFGMILFCLVMVLFVVAFKLGGRLSVVYPVYATTFIWGTLIAIVIGKEPWSMMQLLGVATIIVGVAMIAMGVVE